jgi:hypothetical protein
MNIIVDDGFILRRATLDGSWLSNFRRKSSALNSPPRHTSTSSLLAPPSSDKLLSCSSDGAGSGDIIEMVQDPSLRLKRQFTLDPPRPRRHSSHQDDVFLNRLASLLEQIVHFKLPLALLRRKSSRRRKKMEERNGSMSDLLSNAIAAPFLAVMRDEDGDKCVCLAVFGDLKNLAFNRITNT